MYYYPLSKIIHLQPTLSQLTHNQGINMINHELIQNALEDLLFFIEKGISPKAAAKAAACVNGLDDKQYKQLLTRAVIRYKGTLYIAQ